MCHKKTELEATEITEELPEIVVTVDDGDWVVLPYADTIELAVKCGWCGVTTRALVPQTLERGVWHELKGTCSYCTQHRVRITIKIL